MHELTFLKNRFLIYFLEIGIAAAILWFDQRLFLLFFFVVVLTHMDRKAHETNRFILSYSTELSLGMDMLRRKMGITDTEYEELRQNEIDRMPPDYRAGLDAIEKFVDRR